MGVKWLDRIRETILGPPKYENLVFEGGGMKGIAYAGVIKVLENKHILSNIKKVAGTSAGAIAGLLVVLGYSAGEIREFVFHKVDFKKLQKGGKLTRIALKYGYYKTEPILEMFQELVAERLGNPLATFRDVKELKGRELSVFASNLSTKQVHEFSFRKTPDFPIAQAVLCSMSIPIFFEAVNLNDQILVDGGLVYNYPIFHFGGDHKLRKTIGVAFKNTRINHSHETKVDAFGYRNIYKYAKSSYNLALNGQEAMWRANATIRKATILIDSAGVESTDLGITSRQKETLFNNGVAATKEFLIAQGQMK